MLELYSLVLHLQTSSIHGVPLPIRFGTSASVELKIGPADFGVSRLPHDSSTIAVVTCIERGAVLIAQLLELGVSAQGMCKRRTDDPGLPGTTTRLGRTIGLGELDSHVVLRELVRLADKHGYR